MLSQTRREVNVPVVRSGHRRISAAPSPQRLSSSRFANTIASSMAKSSACRSKKLVGTRSSRSRGAMPNRKSRSKSITHTSSAVDTHTRGHANGVFSGQYKPVDMNHHRQRPNALSTPTARHIESMLDQLRRQQAVLEQQGMLTTPKASPLALAVRKEDGSDDVGGVGNMLSHKLLEMTLEQCDQRCVMTACFLCSLYNHCKVWNVIGTSNPLPLHQLVLEQSIRYVQKV